MRLTEFIKIGILDHSATVHQEKIIASTKSSSRVICMVFIKAALNVDSYSYNNPHQILVDRFVRPTVELTCRTTLAFIHNRGGIAVK